MDEDYRVPSKSNEDIERIASAWRNALYESEIAFFDIFALLEKAGRRFQQTFGLEVIERPDHEMGKRQAYAISEGGSHRIFVRSSIVQGAKDHEPYAVGTLVHELAHIILHPGAAPKARLAISNKTPPYIAPHESAEHQARVFTAAFQMPREEVKKLSSPQQIKTKFGVSLEAAKFRYEEVVQKSQSRDLPESARSYLAERKPAARKENKVTPFIPARRKSREDLIWEAGTIAVNHDPSQYRISRRGYLVRRAEYLKQSHFGWFIVGDKIYAHRETAAGNKNDDEICIECGNLTLTRDGTRLECRTCGLKAQL